LSGIFLNEEDDITLTFEQRQPYHRAIKTLRKISHLKSPREKLGCILQTFKDIIQSFGDFWEHYDREAVIGADDLVPIFAYVILKARIPKVFSEMNFIWEFASDSELSGKYGYGFATFQIGVEIIARFDDTIWKALEVPDTVTSSPHLSNSPGGGSSSVVSTSPSHTPGLPTGNPLEEHLGDILEKRDLLVSQRGHEWTKSDDDDF